MDFKKIDFRELLVSDLDLIHKWLNTDYVSQWYGRGQSSHDQVVQKYGAKINGQAHADPFLILYAGTAILAKFLAKVVFSDGSITSCVIGPEPKNKAAIRCYEKVGFQHYKTVCLPDEPEPEYLMRIRGFAVLRKS